MKGNTRERAQARRVPPHPFPQAQDFCLQSALPTSPDLVSRLLNGSSCLYGKERKALKGFMDK
ncbi:hypothetical protein AB4Z48_26410 [Cupriavidus sp. 2TAF22]|uniref:hypothetical protein n=1 Tax=unclassified Cupriavidus TaxID=2640874 RepID=UPI003F90B358